MYSAHDTIAAVSSATGSAARGIVRLSGPDAIALAATLFSPQNHRNSLSNATARTRLTGRCALTDQISCAAQVYLFHGPHSYTGQDIVELHLPGSPALLPMVLSALLDAGARSAEPGEFTARAFFNGRLDLTQAEAVAGVIAAQSDAQLRAAQRLLDGALHSNCRDITAGIADVLALIEAGIDFSHEDIELASRDQLVSHTRSIQNDLAELLTQSISSEDLDRLGRVVLAGPANAGKSSLANALLKMDRSIVSAIAGTTRDLLTAPLRLTDGECLLIDSAGLGPTEDPLAGTTQQFTRKALASCDLLLWVIDVSQVVWATEIELPTDLSGQLNVILVANKIDLCNDHARVVDSFDAPMPIAKTVAVSALRGDNLDALKQTIEDCLHLDPSASPTSAALALTSRQRSAFQQADQAIGDAISLLDRDVGDELIALELRTALDQLGQVTGEVVTEDLLDRIFSNFCIGK